MLISIIRTILLYAFIILAVRLMGKRQIGDLQTSELVVTLLISDIASMPMQDTALPLLDGIIPILILVACEIAASIFMIKSGKFRKVICGSPVMVIQDGKIMQKEMNRLRMSTEDLCVQLRQQDVFNLEDVQYCIVETNGKMSVLSKPEKRTPNAEELNIQIEDTGIEAVIVNDGVFLDNSLNLCEKDKTWAREKIEEHNLKVEEVYIMTANRAGEYNIIKKGE